MHSDPKLIERVNAATADWRGLTAKKMFGGMAWLLHGNMCVGIWRDSLIVRCGPAEWPTHLKKPHVRGMDITGRSMEGWLLVDAPAVATARGLNLWIEASRHSVFSPLRNQMRPVIGVLHAA